MILAINLGREFYAISSLCYISKKCLEGVHLQQPPNPVTYERLSFGCILLMMVRALKCVAVEFPRSGGIRVKIGNAASFPSLLFSFICLYNGKFSHPSSETRLAFQIPFQKTDQLPSSSPMDTTCDLLHDLLRGSFPLQCNRSGIAILHNTLLWNYSASPAAAYIKVNESCVRRLAVPQHHNHFHLHSQHLSTYVDHDFSHNILLKLSRMRPIIRYSSRSKRLTPFTNSIGHANVRWEYCTLRKI